LGLIAGASHWSLWTIDATGSNSPHAIAFTQMLPLLVIAVAVGSVSANAGTMLVLGYAFGDFLIAGPQLQVRTSAPLAQFFSSSTATDLLRVLLHAGCSAHPCHQHSAGWF
jgi:hypothetical protein